MNHSWKTRVLSMILTVVMIIGLVPMSVFATETETESTTPVTDSVAEVLTLDTDSDSSAVETYSAIGSDGVEYNPNSSTSTDNYYNLISKKDWAIAPGINESQIVLNNADGSQRQVVFVMEADLNNEYVKVINSYTGMVPEYGNYQVSGMSNQAAIAEDMGYGNVVGAMNTTLSWYTNYAADRINEPLGFIMLDAEILFDPANCGYDYGNVGFPSVLVINKDFDDDGNPRPSDIPKVEMPQIRSSADLDGWEDQVIPCSSGYILKDGINQYTPSHTGGAPRSVVGFKPDGTAVIMVNDGRQSPYSAGMSMYELAEVMLDLGCTYAVNCDGGGSTTWLSQRPGEDLKINNSPSDGAERSTTSGILFISTAPSTGEFVRAQITAENDFYTPGSTVQFTAIGTDLVGTATGIPEDAVWQLADSSLGTIDQDGLFTSNGTTGTVTAQIVYNGEVAGQASINVVVPDSLSFAQSNITAPYGKSVELEMVATYGVNTVELKPEDITFVLSDSALGTIEGFTFTAGEDTSVTGGTLTASMAGTDLSCTVKLILGKASAVVADVEDGDASNFMFYNAFGEGAYNQYGRHYVVTAETGKVHSGDYALALELDSSNLLDGFAGGVVGFNFLAGNKAMPVNGTATSIGMWLYLPELEDIAYHQARFYIKGNTTGKTVNQWFLVPGTDYGTDGWHYFSIDTSTLGENETITFFVQFYLSCAANINGENVFSRNGVVTYYVDDITVDYSAAVEDRELPVFSDLCISYDGLDAPVAMNGQTIAANTVAFIAKVADDTTKDNYTGLNIASAKAYIDGVQVTSGFNCTNEGMLSISDTTLGNGPHIVRFEISDNMGNMSYIEKHIVLAGSSNKTTVSVVPADPDADMIPIGSLHWMNIEASAIENVQKVTTTLNLNAINKWELDHMEVAAGFTASYTLDAVSNNATITITRTGSNDQTGAGVLASLPIRTWESELVANGTYTAEEMWTKGYFCSMDIQLRSELGSVAFTDGSSGSFAMAPYAVATELYNTKANMSDASSKTSWHQHTIVALDDQAATCTETGYTGRTYCDVCASEVDWGTTVAATGHSYGFDAEGILKCACGELFNGIHTDGFEYVDGVALVGWVGDSYYANGEKLTGIQKVTAPDSEDEFYYDFGEDGICENKTKYTGMFQDGELYRYSYVGVLTSGWQNIDGAWYYFSSSTMAAVSGHVKVNSVYFDFEENGKLVSGVWVNAFNGYRYYYGPDYYKKEWQQIDGEWYYFSNGYRLTGYNQVKARGDVMNRKWYEFDENGICLGLMDGIYNVDGTYYYIEEGVGVQKYLICVDGDYYYATYGGKLAVGKTVDVLETNCDLPKGTYTFGEDGKMLGNSPDGEVLDINGVLYYYESGKGVEKYLVCVDGDYYYATYGGKLAVNKTVGVLASNCDLPKDTYTFGPDGKMLGASPDGAIVEIDGVLYYYENGKGVQKGLVKVGDDYYYSVYGGKLAVGKTVDVQFTSCDLTKGRYEFGPDGKMLNGIVDKDGTLYYYENGNGVQKGLVKVGDDYYYSVYGGKLAVGKVVDAWLTSCDLPAGRYEFGPDGKMLNGIVDKDGTLYYYENGNGVQKGLVKVGDDYYYSVYTGKLAVGKVVDAWLTSCDLPAGRYEFGPDGKMLNGIVDKDGTLYYYENGNGVQKGLIKVGDDYYYSVYGGKLAVGKALDAWLTSCDLPAGRYEFGPDGKMLNGIVDKDGTLYYYENGNGVQKGLVKVGDDYYYSVYGGKLAVGQTVDAQMTSCDLPTGRYEFGADGKMLNGIVDKDGVLYYYENGQGIQKGLFYLDGYYYYAVYGGKLAMNQTCRVIQTNGLLLENDYTFDEYGRIIK